MAQTSKPCGECGTMQVFALDGCQYCPNCQSDVIGIDKDINPLNETPFVYAKTEDAIKLKEVSIPDSEEY